MKRPVSFAIPAAQRTVLAPAAVTPEGEIVYPEAGLAVDRAALDDATAQQAEKLLPELKPEYVRDRKKVIVYATLRSTQPVIGSVVLSPGFLALFSETLGPKVLVAVPNRYCAYVFPALASRYREYAPGVLEEYRATAEPVSTEVFEIGPDGIRAIGEYSDP